MKKLAISSTFYKLFLSLISVIFIFVILLSSYCFNLFKNQYIQEVQSTTHTMLTTQANILNTSYLQKLNSLFNSLFFNQSNQETIFFLDKYQLEGNHNMVYKISTFLNELIFLYNDIISSIDVYYAKNNIIITHQGGLRYLNSSYNTFYLELPWIKNLSQYPSGLNMEILFIDEQPILYFFWKNPIMVENECVISVKMNPKYLNTFLSNLNSDKEISFICDSNGTIISHTNTFTQDSRILQKLFLENVNSSNLVNTTCTIENERFILSMAPTSSNLLWIVKLTPLNDYYLSLNKLKSNIILFAIFIYLLGFIICYVISKKFYTPLKSLITSICHSYDSADNIKDEYSFLNTYFSTLNNRIYKLEEHLSDNKPMIKHHIIINLLNNSFKSKEDIYYKLGSIQLNFKYNYFYCGCILLDTSVINELPPKYRHLLAYEINSSLENYSKDDLIVLSTVLENNQLVFIFNTNINSYNSIQNLLTNIKTTIFDPIKIKIVISLSQALTSIDQLNESYIKAHNLLNYGFFIHKSDFIINVKHVSSNSSIEGSHLVPLKKLKKYLLADDIESFKLEFSSFKSVFPNCGDSIENLHTSLLTLAHDILEYTKTSPYSDYKLIENKLYSYHNHFWNIEDYFDFIENLILRIHELKLEHSYDTTYQQILTLQVYIDNNLSGDLTLESLADKFFFNPKYLSRLYKDSTGQNLSDYISLKRMEKAKYLLDNTSYSLGQISQEVGYSNTTYFSKCFKKHFGQTPKTYKLSNIIY